MAVAALTQTPEQYIFLDDIPEIYQERQLVRSAAQDLLERRRVQAKAGEYEYQPVDALSTADTVLVAERHWGAHSPEYQEKWQGLLLDCQRLVGEWYRKNTSEYFEPERHVFDDTKEEFFSHGLSIRQMTENALVPITDDPEEEARRVNERVEDATPQIVRKLGGLAVGKSILTISQCTDSAIESYRTDLENGNKHRGYRGYVPEIAKVMLRFITLDPNSYDRFETQIGIPGLLAQHEVFVEALKERGLDAGALDKTGLHSAQILVDEDPFEFLEHLDNVTSEQWARANIFMGEEVPEDFVKDYDKFKHEALQRKKDMEGWSQTVALFVLDLAREGFDRKKAPEHVENFVKNLLLNIAKQDTTVAEQMFDTKTANGLREVVALENQGRFEEAQKLWTEVEKNAPGGGSCGAGSCGLEGVNSGSKEDKELRDKLGADEGDIIVKDKERACKCGSKSIIYAYNKKKVIKYCESCNASEKTFKKAA